MGNNWTRLTRFPVRARFTIKTLACNGVLWQNVISFKGVAQHYGIIAYFASIQTLSSLRRCSVLSLKVIADLG